MDNVDMLDQNPRTQTARNAAQTFDVGDVAQIYRPGFWGHQCRAIVTNTFQQHSTNGFRRCELVVVREDGMPFPGIHLGNEALIPIAVGVPEVPLEQTWRAPKGGA